MKIDTNKTKSTIVDVKVLRLSADDRQLMKAMLKMFGAAFNEVETYTSAIPSNSYLQQLLGRDDFIALAAVKSGSVIGGLAAYVLPKFEQERSEIYIYDLAVDVAHRRRGVATGLIKELKKVAAASDAHVVFIQADVGDEPAIALYDKLGVREEVLHFDIDID